MSLAWSHLVLCGYHVRQVDSAAFRKQLVLCGQLTVMQPYHSLEIIRHRPQCIWSCLARRSQNNPATDQLALDLGRQHMNAALAAACSNAGHGQLHRQPGNAA